MIYDTLHQIIALGSEVREMSEKEFHETVFKQMLVFLFLHISILLYNNSSGANNKIKVVLVNPKKNCK